MKKKFSIEKLISILTVLAVLAIWYCATEFGWISQVMLPSPKTVFQTFCNMCQNGYKGTTIVGHMLVSMKRLFLALFFAV